MKMTDVDNKHTTR